MSFPAELDDPTLTADGTKCGENMVNCYIELFIKLFIVNNIVYFNYL